MLTFFSFSFYLAVASVTICLRSPEGIIAESEPRMDYFGAFGILGDLMEMGPGLCKMWSFYLPVSTWKECSSGMEFECTIYLIFFEHYTSKVLMPCESKILLRFVLTITDVVGNKTIL